MLRTRLLAGPTTGLILAAVFATVLVGVFSLEVLFEPMRVNPYAPAPVSLRLPPTIIKVTAPDGKGSKLITIAPTIARGEVVRDERIAELVILYEATRRPLKHAVLVGMWVVYFLIASLLTKYLRTYSPSRGALLRTQVAVLGLSVILLLVAKGFFLFTGLSPYLIPTAAMPMWLSIYLDRRTAFVVSIALSMLLASFLGFNLAHVAVYLASGIAASLLLWDRKHSTVFAYGGFTAGIAAALVIIAGRLLSERMIDIGAEILNPLESDLASAFIGGLFAGAVAFALRGFVVSVLGAVSRGRLIDLTDLDQPLLKKMAAEAPGSWEHARAMANLAEAASAAIGADSLLTRVGAYYHDLGKTVQPKYFIENLEYGERSPHEDLEPDVSADAIMAHVVEGTHILRREGIPEPVVEFAYTHHGTTVTEYFWHKCLAQGNPKGLTEDAFRYPGMRPRTKETAILMLIDSIEAASRTINPPERERFEEMVHRVLFTKLKQGQLDESGLTVQDLHTLATGITEALVNIYHNRIRYPWQEQQNQQNQKSPPHNSRTMPVPAPQIHTETLRPVTPLHVEQEGPTKPGLGSSDRKH